MGDQFEAESLLVEVAASHNLSVGPDEIRAALYDDRHGADLARWAASNLAPDNLLTVDELSLYDALDRSGQVDRLAELYDLSEMRPLRQDDVRAAVDDLRLSTESMNKQAETLRHQRDAWQRLVANRADTVAKRRELETSRQRKSDSERVRISSEITEIAHGLEFRIAELKHDSDPNVTSLHQALDVVLKSDDALLTSLQKLGWELSEPDPEEAKSTDKLRETCLRLIKITVETIRTRLDTTYLTALATAQQSRDTSVDPDEIEALQAELESLYSEILPVAQMSVEQQHLEPALRSIASRSGQSLRKTASALTYMSQCFDYLLSRINALHTHTELYNAHHAAVNRVVAIARDEMAAEVPAPDPQPTNPIEAASSIKQPTRTKRHSRDMTHRRRSSGTPHLTALDSLMQSLALPMDAYGDTSGATSQITALSRLVRERRSKNSGAAHSAQDEFEAATAERLDDAQRAVQLLWDSVLADTAFGAAALADPGIEQSIDVLAQEVAKAKDKLGRFESQKMGWGSLKRDEFIERWARQSVVICLPTKEPRLYLFRHQRPPSKMNSQYTDPKSFRPNRHDGDVHAGVVFNDELDERLACMELVQQHLDKGNSDAEEGLQRTRMTAAFCLETPMRRLRGVRRDGDWLQFEEDLVDVERNAIFYQSGKLRRQRETDMMKARGKRES